MRYTTHNLQNMSFFSYSISDDDNGKVKHVLTKYAAGKILTNVKIFFNGNPSKEYNYNSKVNKPFANYLDPLVRKTLNIFLYTY